MSGQPAIQSGGGAAPLSTNTNQLSNQFQQMLSPQNSNSGFKSSPGVGK